MGRSRASAKAAGSRFERVLADWFKVHVSRFVDRKVRTGARDTGDLANVESASGLRITVEAKDYGGRFLVGPWLNEVEVERINDGGDVGLVIAKRRGVTDPGAQVVITTVHDIAVLLTGTPKERP